MSRRECGITAKSTSGRVLLALRAGRMSYEQLIERFPCGPSCVQRLKETGHVDVQSGYYALTEAGRRACPSRRAAAGANL